MHAAAVDRTSGYAASSFTSLAELVMRDRQPHKMVSPAPTPTTRIRGAAYIQAGLPGGAHLQALTCHLGLVSVGDVECWPPRLAHLAGPLPRPSRGRPG